jgi:hypothetical protein
MTRMLFGRARGHWPAQLRFDAPTQGSELHRIGVKPSGLVQRLQRPWVGRVPAGAVKYRQAGEEFLQANRNYAQASRDIEAVQAGRQAATRGRGEDTIPAYQALRLGARRRFVAGASIH